MRYLLCATAMLLAGLANAEPYLAVQTGYACNICHVNPTGAGLRTPFGNAFSQQQLSVRTVSDELWTGEFADRFGIGANARFAARRFDVDDQDNNLDFAVDRVAVYASAMVNDHVSVYLDQQVAPGGSLNREAWAMFAFERFYVKAGKIFVPLGWRLQDDTAFIRQVTGVNLNGGDNGIELGYQGGAFNVQLAVTNGTGGSQEIDDGKQFALRGEWVQSAWRAGLSVLRNDTDLGERLIYGVFAGIKTGAVSWLFEYDRIEDQGFAPVDLEQDVALVEANIRVRKGHNLKLTFESRTFDDNREDQFRASVVYEYFPWAFTQLRFGLRSRDSDDDLPSTNGEEIFLQAHVYF